MVIMERTKNGTQSENIDDVTKAMKVALTKIKKRTTQEEKLNGLVDILELVKAGMQTLNISDEEFFEHLHKRREECGVFVTERNKNGEE